MRGVRGVQGVQGVRGVSLPIFNNIRQTLINFNIIFPCFTIFTNIYQYFPTFINISALTSAVDLLPLNSSPGATMATASWV